MMPERIRGLALVGKLRSRVRVDGVRRGMIGGLGKGRVCEGRRITGGEIRGRRITGGKRRSRGVGGIELRIGGDVRLDRIRARVLKLGLIILVI